MARETLAIGLMAVATLPVSFAVLLSASGRGLILIFLLALVAWTLYLVAHYLANGIFVDGEGVSSHGLPETSKQRLGASVGLVSMVAGFPIGIVAVHRDSLAVMLLAQAAFMGGYMVAHESVTGKIL